MSLVGGSIVLIAVSVVWALVPGRGGLALRRLLPGLTMANIGLAVLTDQTIHGWVGKAMVCAFLGVAAWLLIQDVRLGRRSLT